MPKKRKSTSKRPATPAKGVRGLSELLEIMAEFIERMSVITGRKEMEDFQKELQAPHGPERLFSGADGQDVAAFYAILAGIGSLQPKLSTAGSLAPDERRKLVSSIRKMANDARAIADKLETLRES